MITDRTSILWLGEYPSEWRHTRIKRISEFSPSFSGRKPEPGENCSVIPMEAVSEFGDMITENQELYDDVNKGLTLFENGDVLFAKITPCMENGKGAYVENLPTRYAFGSTEFHVMRPSHGIDGKFLYYVTFNPFFRSWAEKNMHGAAGQKRVPTRFLKYTDLPLPSLPEQKRIAAYLDASCAAIDQAVGKKQKQLETLDDLRKSIIHRAITRGLNPRVKLKDSGVSWLGQVPSHWTVARIKRHTSMIRGKFTHRPRNDPAFYDGPYPFFQTGSIARANKYITEYHQTLNEHGLAVSRLFPRGIIVMSIAANIGDVAITDFEGCFPDSIVGFIPDPQTDANFLYYLLKSMKPIMLRSAILTTQLNLNYIRIGANFCAYPPKREQEEIGVYLDQKMDESQKLSFNISEQISTLVDYRKSLIHECITGKRRITETDIEKVEAYV